MFKYNLVSLCLISSISLIPIAMISCKQTIVNNTKTTGGSEENSTNSNNKTKPPEQRSEFKFNNADDFFPKMNIKDYYDFLDFENHVPIITEKLKLNFVRDVIRRVATSRGDINFYIEETSKQKVTFYFKWTYNSSTLYKTYVLDVEKKLD